MDLSKQLHAYEVEYHVLQDEVLDGGAVLDDSDHLDKLEKTNVQLKKQNMDLLEKLQVRVTDGRVTRHGEGSSFEFFKRSLCPPIDGSETQEKSSVDTSGHRLMHVSPVKFIKLCFWCLSGAQSAPLLP